MQNQHQEQSNTRKNKKQGQKGESPDQGTWMTTHPNEDSSHVSKVVEICR